MRAFLKHLHGEPGPGDEIIYDFLLAFSRWEYALKMAGDGKYAGVGSGDHVVTVKWRDWARDHLADWEQKRPTSLSAFEIIQKPPQYQAKMMSGRLEPRDRAAPAQEDLTSVLDLVYAVRNNLFHGGKWAMRDPARDERLLEQCLSLVEMFIDLDDEVKNYFYELGPPPKS